MKKIISRILIWVVVWSTIIIEPVEARHLGDSPICPVIEESSLSLTKNIISIDDRDDSPIMKFHLLKQNRIEDISNPLDIVLIYEKPDESYECMSLTFSYSESGWYEEWLSVPVSRVAGKYTIIEMKIRPSHYYSNSEGSYNLYVDENYYYAHQQEYVNTSYSSYPYSKNFNELYDLSTLNFTVCDHTNVSSAVEEKVTLAPTCRNYGIKTISHVCTRCNGTLSVEKERVEKTDHSWDDGTVIKTATCKEKGAKLLTCRVCGFQKTEDMPIDKSVHSWNAGVATKLPTCKYKGQKTYTCVDCGQQKIEDIPLDATAHKWNAGLIIKKSTCMSEGSKEYTCAICGIQKTEKIPAGSEHAWGEAITITQPTCLSEGKIIYECGECGDTKTVKIKKLTPTIKLSTTKKIVKCDRSFILKITQLGVGDYIASTKCNKKSVASIKKITKNQYKIVGKKKGTAIITVKLKSGKSAKCKITVI